MDTPPAAILTSNINGVTLTAPATATICAGEEVAFIANAVAGGSYRFLVDGIEVRARADSNVYSTTALLAGEAVTVEVFDQNTAAAPAGCSDVSDAINILVTAVPTITVTSTALGNEICTGDAITFFANASIAGATYDFEVNSVSIQNSTSQSFDPAAYGITIGNGDVIQVTASTGVASCSNATASLTVLTNAISTVGTITVATPTVCLNDVIPAMTGTAAVASGTVSYQWQRRDQTTSVFTNIGGATSQNYTPSITTLLTTDTFFRRITVSNTGTTTCEAFSNVISVLVDTPPAATLSANINGSVVTAATTATICNGEEVIFTAGTVTGGSYEFLVDNIVVRPRADSNVYTTTALLANNSVTVRVYDQNTAAAPAGCSADSAPINILITAVPTLTVTSTALGDEICEGDAITFFANASIAGVNYTFRLNGVLLQNGLNQSFDPAAYGQTVGNGDVIEVEASTGVASCSSVVTSITVIENVISSAGTITTATPTICSGETAPPLIGTDQSGLVSGTLSYQWQVSIDNNVTYSDIVFATSQNYTPTTVITSDTFFRRKTISNTGTTTCEKISNVVRVQVDMSPVASLSAIQRSVTTVASGTLNICVGEEIIFSAAPVTAGFTYEFTIDGVVVQARSTQSTYTSTSLANNENVRVEVFSGAVTDTTACSDISDRFNIQTLPTPIPTLISNVIADTFCVGEEVIFTAGSNLASNSYEFFVNGNSYQNSTTNVFNPSDLTPPVLLNDNDIVRVIVTSNPYSFASCTAVATLSLSENIILDAGTINTVSTTLCSGETPAALTPVAVASATGAISYRWESGLDTITFNPIPSTNSSTYVPGSLTQTTYFRRITISTLNGKACEEASNILEITVTPPINGGTVSPTNQVICSGQSPVTLQIVGGSTGLAIAYQWQESPDGITFTDITSATSQDYSPPVLNATRFYRRVTNAAGGGPPASCTEVSSITRITVIDLDPGTLDPTQNQAYCFGAMPPTLVSSPTGGLPADATSTNGTITYQWQMSIDNANWTNIASATNNFYNPPSLIQTTWYRRVARSSINAVDFCEDVTAAVEIEILPDLNEGFVLDDQVVCQVITAFDLPNALVLDSAETLTNSVTYQWQQSSDQLSWTDISGQQSATLDFSIGDAWIPTQPATYYRGVITYVGDPAPAAYEQTSIELIDEAGAFTGNLTYSIAINGNQYSVVSSNTSNIDSIGAALANSITVNDFVVNAEYNASTDILTIVPVTAGTYNVAASTGAPSPTIAFTLPTTGRELNMRILVQGNTGGRTPNTNMESCQVYTEVVAIEVVPQPTLVQVSGDPSPQEVCVGDTIDPITFAFGGGATTVEIQNLAPGLTVSPSAGGTVTPSLYGNPNWYEVGGTSTFTILGTVNGASTFRLVTAGSGCSAVSETYEIQIIPNATTPDFIRMNTNTVGSEVVSQTINGVNYWFNNTVCQDDLPAPTTTPTEFFACFVNDALNRQFNTYEWNFDPPTAGAMTQNNFQETTVGIIQTTVSPSIGVAYSLTLTISGTTNTYTVTSTLATQSADEVGLELATLADANPGISVIYNNVRNEIVLESDQPNIAFTVSVSPTGTAQALRLVPPATRQITRSGTMNWDPSFTGTSTIRVRSIGCDGPSPWLEVQIDVVPQTVVATATLSDLIEPIAPNFQVCGGEFTGELPVCQITAATPDTTFFTASDNGTDPNEFGSLEWRVSNPQPGLGALVSSPGTIDSTTGVMDWTTGWWGSFELQVRPISCSGVAGDWKSRTIVIGPQNGPITSVTPATPLPECPIPAGGYTATLTTGGQSVRWYVNSQVGLATSTTYLQSNTLFELDPGADDSTLTLDFRPGFSGNIIITAEPTPCPGESVNYVISVPDAPQINLTSGFNSNNQQLCSGTALNTITYDIEGAANRVLARNLPPGVTPLLEITSQLTTITLNTVTGTTIGRTYSISIDNVRYDFVTTVATNAANAAIHIGNGLVNAINAGTNNFDASFTGGAIVIEVGPSGQPGNSFTVASTSPVNPAINFAAPIASPLSKIFSLFGSPTVTGSAVFNYSIETEAPQPGCEVAVSSGTIEILEPATINVTQGSTTASYCSTGIDFNGANAIILEFDGATSLIVDPLTPLPNGLVFGLRAGTFDEYEITGTLNQTVLAPTSWVVNIETNGAGCGEVTETITFNLEPNPNITLVTAGGGDRTVCASQTILPIRYEIYNPAFAMTASWDVTPTGLTYQNYAQNQIVEFNITQMGTPTITAPGDVFTFNVNGTNYTAITNGASSTLNINALTTTLQTWLDGILADQTVTSNGTSITFEAINPGVAFTVTTAFSSTFDAGTGVIIRPPAYFEISGTASNSTNGVLSHIYTLTTAGPGCSGGFAVSGTIDVNPVTSGVFTSSSDPNVTDENPLLCDGSGITTLNFNAPNAVAVSVVATTPSWITATKVGNDVVVSMNVPNLGLSLPATYSYAINLIGNAFGCTATPTPITGIVTVSPEDIITFAGTPGDDAQIVCVNNLPSPTFAFEPIEYQLSGGATTISSITYRQDGGAVTSGLPPGFGFTINASNTLIINGIATAAAANALASTTIYEYVIETGPGSCGTDTISGTIEVRTAPELTLTSSPSTSNQVVCDVVDPIDTIVYELGPGADNVLFTWTSGASNVLGLTATLNPARTEFTISGTPAMNVTQTTVYNYQIETTGSDCSPEIVLNGSLTLEPQDSISLIITPTLPVVAGTASQTVCFMDLDNPANAIAEPIQPIEYQLDGGAIGNPVSIRYRANGGAYIPGLPAGLGSTVTASNTVLITGSIVASTTYVTPTMVYEYEIQTTGGCVTDTINGFITTLSPPVMTLVSSATTVNQVICDGTPIQDIVYEIQGGATTFGFSWVGSNSLAMSGLTAVPSGTNRYVISGTPTTNVTQTTVYNYEIFTTGSACVSEVTLTGSIQIEPGDAITLISSPTTDNQSVCLFDDDNPANAIAELMMPIEYQLEGGAIGEPFSISYSANGGPSLNGLPPGLGYTLTPSDTILISGSIIASTTFTTPTVVYTYEIVTGGSCATTTISGDITVHSPPVFELTSGVTTTNQTGYLAVCDRQDPIADIVYEFYGGATNVVFSWTGPTLNGVNGIILTGTNSLVISGIPSVNVTQTTQYPYQVTTDGSACAPEIVYTGVIEVKPVELLTLASLPATENQTICAGTGTNTLDPIIYNLEQEAVSAVVSFTPALPGIGYTVTSSQVIISGTAQAAAQASTTILNYLYEVETTGCGPARESGTITILPTPVMTLFAGNPNQPSVCNNSPIDPVDYIFNPQSGATFSISWDQMPSGISATLASGAGGTNNIVRVQGTPSVQVSSTTTYNYQITLSGTCDPDVVVSGSITVDPGPIIDTDYIQDFLVFDVDCNGANTGSIELGSPTDPDFLNAITSVTPGSVQISEINFTPSGVVTYTDIFRVYINGTEYNTRGGQTTLGVNSVYSENDIINDLISRINNDPAQQDVTASLNSFGLRLQGTVEGVSFTVSANTSDTNAISNTVTTTQIANVYAPVLRWTFPDSSVVTATNIYNLYAGSYALEVIVNSCISSATFVVEEPPALDFEVDFCGGTTGAITVQASGGIAPYTYTVEYNGVRLPGASGIRVTNGQANFTGLTPGRLYVVEVTDTSSCTLPLTRAVRIPTGLNFDPTIVQVTDSYCSTGTTGNGSIVTSRLISGTLVNAFTGGSGLYNYAWAESLTGTRVIGTQPNLENLPPGDYYLTLTDAVLGCEYPTQLISVGGYASVRLNGVETANFVNIRGSGSVTSSATADFIYTLDCNGDSNAAFDLFAVGGSGNLEISSLTPGTVLPAGIGSAVSLSNLPAGTYVFEVTDLSPPLDPDGNVLSACTDLLTVRVEEPDALSMVLIDSYDPLCPDDVALGGRLEFAVSGGNPLAQPYTISLNNGLLTASSGASSRVVFNNINVLDPNQRRIFAAEITDSFGCSQVVTFTYEFPEIYTYTVALNTENIDCTANTSGEVTFDITPSDSAGDLSTTNQGQLYIRAQNRPYEYYETLESNGPILINNITLADTYEYVISINNTTTCEIASGTFDIIEVNNQQLDVDLDVIQPGCGNDESRVSLTISNAVPPLSIDWYEYKNITVSAVYTTTGSTTILETATSTTPRWVELPDYSGNAIVNGLESGIYRAIATDARVSTCDGNEFITRNIIISENTLSVTNFRSIQNIPAVGAGDCTNYPEPSLSIDWANTSDSYTNDIFFNVSSNVRRNTNYNGVNITLTGPDGSNVDLSGNTNIYGLPTQPSLERPGFTYRFRNLPSGPYTLTVTENVSGTTFVPCEEIFFFTVREFLPIEYNGDTVFVTDLCTGAVDGGIQASAIGGDPFIVDGVPTYQFEWTYTPNDPTEPTQIFYGDRVDPAYPGQYCLRILDRNSHSYCSCDAGETNPVTIEVEDIVQPFFTEGTLTDPDNLGTVVKSLPPDCESGGLNGQIGVQITGGQLPYTINWYAEDPRALNDPNNPGYRLLNEYTNRTSLQDLLPGNYKMVIVSQAETGCSQNNQYTYYEEIIQVSPNRELYIMDGPYVDEDLCTGQQGRLLVDIFDNNNGNLSFYYNDILIPNSDVVRLSDRSWSVAIVNAVDDADFRIVNEEGCWITTEINRGIGEPNFSYTSPNYEASSVILAREEVTFENTSTDPYVRSEWIFGDNTPPVDVPTLIDSIIPVRHTYGISGTYFTTMRIYNDIGCSEEITIPISVGKGYNILVPNVFTPNNDLVNDNFRPLFSGFLNMTFTIYDYRGNVVYNEYVEEADPNNIQGISITGWDGSLAPFSPYYIYTAYGVLLDGETEVEKSGTFIVIN